MQFLSSADAPDCAADPACRSTACLFVRSLCRPHLAAFGKIEDLAHSTYALDVQYRN